MTNTPTRLGLLFAAAFLAGCNTFPKTAPNSKDDPLVGGTVSPVNATPLALNPANNPAPATALPPLTQATPTSTAALASGAYPPLVGGKDLRIGPSPSGAGGNKIQPPHLNPPGVVAVITADNAQPNGSGVVPLDANGTKPASPTYTPTSISGGGVDQAMATLNTYNPRWSKLESGGPGVWRFSCSVPDRSEPGKNRTLEAEAETAVGAIQNVLDRLR
jgi:hypothetical protein